MILDSEEQLIKWRLYHRSKTVVTNGVFDIIHRGHVEFLHAASELGYGLIVGINSDNSVKELKGPSRPINSEMDRAKVLNSLRSVSAVYIFDSVRCVRFLELSRPDIYVKAGDYSEDSIDPSEKEQLKKCGSVISFLNFVGGYSTTSIINKVKG